MLTNPYHMNSKNTTAASIQVTICAHYIAIAIITMWANLASFHLVCAYKGSVSNLQRGKVEMILHKINHVAIHTEFSVHAIAKFYPGGVEWAIEHYFTVPCVFKLFTTEKRNTYYY